MCRLPSSVRTLPGPSAASSARPRVSPADAIRSFCEPPGGVFPFSARQSVASGITFIPRVVFEGAGPDNPDRVRKLKEHGLTEYQARVYLTLLDLGAATATQISPLSKVPRTRIYATMQQLHQKGLVQILPETPLRYEPVSFDAYLRALGDDLRSRAKQIDAGLDLLAREFAVNAQREPESHGRFEAIYGRKTVRERLLRMYAIASREVIGIGTTRSPGRILGARSEEHTSEL